jgi:hypothetical protein
MNKEIIEELNTIKMWFISGAIPYEKAKILADPYIKAFNIKSKEIAKKHNVSPRYISFSSFMR